MCIYVILSLEIIIPKFYHLYNYRIMLIQKARYCMDYMELSYMVDHCMVVTTQPVWDNVLWRKVCQENLPFLLTNKPMMQKLQKMDSGITQVTHMYHPLDMVKLKVVRLICYSMRCYQLCHDSALYFMVYCSYMFHIRMSKANSHN